MEQEDKTRKKRKETVICIYVYWQWNDEVKRQEEKQVACGQTCNQTHMHTTQDQYQYQ